MIQATINGKSFSIEKKAGQTLLDGDEFPWEMQHISGNRYHVLKDNVSYNVEVVERDSVAKTVKLKINGELIEVNLKDETDLLLEKLGLNVVVDNVMKNLKAPMPGLIYELKVQSGDTVEKGDVLLILVAMKMENAIKAPGSGVVKEVKVNLNDSVEKNQVMVTFE